MLLAVRRVGHGGGVGVLVLHVEHAGADVDDGLERRVPGHVLDALAVNPDLAIVANAFSILLAGPDHRYALSNWFFGIVGNPLVLIKYFLLRAVHRFF